mgnify:CR=1 FL=1
MSIRVSERWGDHRDTLLRRFVATTHQIVVVVQLFAMMANLELLELSDGLMAFFRLPHHFQEILVLDGVLLCSLFVQIPETRNLK